MTLTFLLILSVVVALFGLCFLLLLRWWFTGGSTRAGSPTFALDVSGEPSVIMFGFPDEKYQAICRLLDPRELRAIERTQAMPADLMRRLESGRREVLASYLDELSEDFRQAQWLFAQEQSTGYVASPSAVRELLAGWWRFRRLNRKVRRNAKRGQLNCGDVEPLVREVRLWFEKVTGGARLEGL